MPRSDTWLPRLSHACTVSGRAARGVVQCVSDCGVRVACAGPWIVFACAVGERKVPRRIQRAEEPSDADDRIVIY